MFLIVWGFLAPVAFYLHRYGVHWMQTPERVRKNVRRLLPLMAATSLVGVIKQSRGVIKLTLPLWIGWTVSIGALVLALLMHTIQRVARECACNLGSHVVQAYSCLFAGLILLANLLISFLLFNNMRVPTFGLLGWSAYALLWVIFLSVSEMRLWREAGYFETDSDAAVA